MYKFVQIIENVIQTSDNVKTTYELEYQSLQDTMYKYVGLFVSDADDDKLHDLADEIAAECDKIGKVCLKFCV